MNNFIFSNAEILSSRCDPTGKASNETVSRSKSDRNRNRPPKIQWCKNYLSCKTSKFIDPIDPVRKSIDPALNPALNSFIERVSEIKADNRVDRVNKKRAIPPHAKTDLGEWEITEEIGEYEYIADDE